MTELAHPPIDPGHFRSVLGSVPTGVVVITACGDDGVPVGMTVGTFTSVSLDPPLVGFLATRSSASWNAIKAAGSFCANVLSDEQEAACRIFSSRTPDKFVGITWSPAASGSPVLEDVLAWVDCDIEAVMETGDHDIVVGRVRALQPGASGMPLVFLQGGYGTVDLRSSAGHGDFLLPFRLAELARPVLDRLAAALGRECILTAAVQEELVLVASVGTPEESGTTRVGQRMPHLPPLGALFVAWADGPAQAAWLRRLPPELGAEVEGELTRRLERVRTRGFTVGVGRPVHLGAESLLARSFGEQRSTVRASVVEVWEVLRDGVDPEVLDQRPGYEIRSLAVPVFDARGHVVLSVGVHALPTTLTWEDATNVLETLMTGAQAISAVLPS